MTPGPLMLDIAGTAPDAEDRELFAHPEVGGLILFSRNFESADQLHALVAALRAVRADLVIAVDQEGGRVQRFRDGFTPLPPAAAFGRLYARDPQSALRAAHECGWLMATELRAFDIDLSFAPVLDLDYARSGIIGDRAFDADPERVAELAGAYLRGMHAAGMPGTGKHFPGHGWVVPDSHLELPVDERPLQALLDRDLQPFVKLMGEGLDAVMPAHIVFEQVDHHPVGFSPRWLREILRKELHFEGVIFSDDLSMAGAAVAGDMGDRVRAALYAGCDMVLVCNDRPAALEALEALESASSRERNPRLARLCPHRAATAGEDRERAARARQLAAGLCEK